MPNARSTALALALPAAAALLSACAMSPMPPMPATTAAMQNDVPDAVKVPPGHAVAMETVGSGSITYECREKTGMAGSHEWVFVGPDAALADRMGRPLGRYYGPPATWEHRDGSKFTGTQVAVAPAGSGSIPLQLVKANPAMGQGMLSGVTYVQRLATQGGVAPAMACDAASKGRKEVVQYRADYVLWKAA